MVVTFFGKSCILTHLIAYLTAKFLTFTRLRRQGRDFHIYFEVNGLCKIFVTICYAFTYVLFPFENSLGKFVFESFLCLFYTRENCLKKFLSNILQRSAQNFIKDIFFFLAQCLHVQLFIWLSILKSNNANIRIIKRNFTQSFLKINGLKTSQNFLDTFLVQVAWYIRKRLISRKASLFINVRKIFPKNVNIM